MKWDACGEVGRMWGGGTIEDLVYIDLVGRGISVVE